MSVISGFFQGLAQKAANEPMASEFLSYGLKRDLTANSGALRKLKAIQLGGGKGKELLLSGLSDDAEFLGNAFIIMRDVITLQTKFQRAAKDLPAQMTVNLQVQGQRLFDFKATMTESGGYYLEIENNSSGGGMILSTLQREAVEDIDAVEDNLIKGLNGALNLTSQDAAYVLKKLTHNI